MTRLPGDGTTVFDRTHFDFSPWSFWRRADEAQRARQLLLQEDLRREWGYSIGEECYVSEQAAVQNDALTLGDRSYIAAGAYLTGDVTLGRDCSVNPYTVIRGSIRIGDAVRIGAHSSIIGFNHVIDDPDVEFFRQGLTARGIVIGDDVWIGSNVSILDGVTVGPRSVVAAGAIVTKDVPEGAIVGGNPARILKWRVQPKTSRSSDLRRSTVARLADHAREQLPAVLDRAWNEDCDAWSDTPGVAPTVRAQCDAIEIADLLTGAPPPHHRADDLADRLQSWQDPATGLVGALAADGRTTGTPDPDAPDAQYHVLAVGYALDILGRRFRAPIRAVTQSWAVPNLSARLDTQPWATTAWHSGAWVDTVATALAWNRLGGEPDEDRESALFGWLYRHSDPATGMWGRRTDHGLLQPVNGFYRASRGSFAQFGIPVPSPARVVDTVLDHAKDPRYFSPGRYTACNVLDVAHPLWLTRESGHRSDDVQRLADALIDITLSTWVDGEGIAFQPGALDASGRAGLQGTEMWLAILWLLTDLTGASDALGYHPRGIHRPEPHPGLVDA